MTGARGCSFSRYIDEVIFMARVTTGSSFGLTTRQALALQALAGGHGEERAALLLMDCRGEDGSTDPQKLRKAKRQLHALMQDDRAQACYRSILKEAAFDGVARAAAKLIQQIDDPQGWLAQGAAREVLSRFWSLVYGDEERAQVIRIEGMPALGVPGSDELRQPAGEEAAASDE